MSIIWVTPSGFIANIQKGESYQYPLTCNVGNTVVPTFTLLAGQLPDGLSLSGPTNNPTLHYPTIFGTTDLSTNTGSYEFTIRATDSGGNLVDRSFSLFVPDLVPTYIYPNANLGTFPDGAWMFTSVAPLDSTPELMGNIQIISGSIPGNLTFDPTSGNISGYVNPSVLYTGPAIYANFENTSPNLPQSVNSKTFTFQVEYDPYNYANYNIVVMRADLFANANANLSGPVYHDPIFVNAIFDPIANSTPNLNIGLVDGGNLYYQCNALDWEGNSLKFSATDLTQLPGNGFSINANTGWLTGFINRDDSVPTPYDFTVTVEKALNANYSTTANATISVDNPYINNVIWTGPSDLGNIIPGIPCSISLTAEIVQPFTAPAINPAKANCTMKLVSVDILNGGNAFTIGDIFTVSGGLFGNAAQVIVSNVTPAGTINQVTINSNIIQHYTEIPSALNVIWINDSGNSNALNAIFGLSFGVDEVNIINGGGFFDTATVGFTPVGEANSAVASSLIHNGVVSNIIVDETGDGYQYVPQVVIHGKSKVTATNPINYQVTDGIVPAGLELLSNGMLVGLASMQIIDNPAIFTVTASIGQNSNVPFVETDLNPANGNNTVYQAFQSLVEVNQTFTLGLNTSNLGISPRTNLSIEFLLDQNDINTLYGPLYNESIVPNTQIYRQPDFYFGVAPHVRMLLAYGIQPVIPAVVQRSISEYFSNKTYSFNQLQWAQSTTEGYEIVYILPQDQFTNDQGETFSGSITYNTPSGEMTAYPPTLPNMINQLQTNLNGFDYRFLPTWMTDYQPNGQILGFTPAIPLVYTKPGYGQKIMYYLQEAYGNSLLGIQATTDRLIWNTGYSENWDPLPRVVISGGNSVANISGGGTFTINTALPLSLTANYTPRTYDYIGNTVVTLPSGMSNIANVVTTINDMFIEGIFVDLDPNYNIQINNITGCPFFLYDGTNTPLEGLSILPEGTGYANVANIMPAYWWITGYIGSGENDILTESLSILLTEIGDNIITENSSNIPIVSDMFLTDDEGATYIVYPLNNFIPISVVTV